MERFLSFKEPLKVISGRQEVAMKSESEDLPRLAVKTALMMTSQRMKGIGSCTLVRATNMLSDAIPQF